MRRLLFCCSLLPGCVQGEAPPAGQETGPCVEGSCFDGLMCLSDLCVGPDAEPSETGGEVGESSASESSSSASSASSPGDTGNDPTGNDPTGNDPTGNDPTGNDPTGDPSWGSCEQLDLLFVVDNSGSMLDEQGTLAAAAPDFFADLVARSGSEDHHVMVVDSDAWVFGGCEANQCPLFQTCLGWDEYVCGETQPLACEDVLGAGVTHPRGTDASNEDCGFPAGQRYVSLSDAGAVSSFECAAAVGTGSTLDPEVPMAAMVTAVNPVAGGAAADCNAGFLRNDAPLVVVFVTDEDDAAGDSPGSPVGWAASLAAAKGGDGSRIAVLGLFGDNDQQFPVCDLIDDANNGAEPSERLHDFVAEFGNRGLRSSVCAAEYTEALTELLDVLDTMCE